MAKNDFEHKVRAELEQLRVRPSEEVWNQVKAGIGPAKRRRRWLLWIPVLVGGIATGGFWYFNQMGSQNNQLAYQQREKDINNSKKQGGLKDLDQQHNVTALSNTEQSAEIRENHQQKEIIPEGSGKFKLDGKLDQKHDFTNPVPGRHLSLGPLSKIKSKTRNNNHHSVPPEWESTGVIRMQKGDRKANNESVKEGNINEKTTMQIQDSGIPDSIREVNVYSITSPGVDSAARYNEKILNQDSSKSNHSRDSALSVQTPPRPLKKSYHEWEWSISLQAGISNIQQDFFVIPGAGMSSADYSQPNSGGGNAGAGTISSGNEAAFSWGLGLLLKRNLDPKWGVQTGIKYNQYSSTIFVGNKVDSQRNVITDRNNLQVDNFYRSGKSNQVRNRLHYLELPVTVEFKTGLNKKIPFYWGAGLTTGYLLGSKYVYADQSQSIYYSDPSLLRKWIWGMQLGFSAGLFKQEDHELKMGPRFQYNFSNLLSPGFSGSRHLGFLGLEAAWKF